MASVRRSARTVAWVASAAALLLVVDLVSTARIVDATRTELSVADLLPVADDLVDAVQDFQASLGTRDAVIDRLVVLEARQDLSEAMRDAVREVRDAMARCRPGAAREPGCADGLNDAVVAADRLEGLVADEVRQGRIDLGAQAERVWDVTRGTIATTLAALLAIVVLVGTNLLRRFRQGAELESQQRVVRFLTERGADLVARQGLDGVVRWVSHSIERLLGFRPEQVVGLRAAELVHPDDRAALRALTDASAGASPTRSTRFRVVRKDGGQSWFEASTTPLFDDGGAVSEMLLSARDVTREVEAEAEVRAGQDRLRAALEAGLDAFYILDAKRGADGRIVDFVFVDVNAVGAAALGRPREEAIGASVFELLPVVRHNGQFEEFASVVATGQALLRELEYDVPGRGKRTLQQQVVRVGDGIAISARDVTERVHTDARLRQVQKLESLGRLGAGVAHDFNNNLATIRNLAVLARETPGLPRAAQDDLDTILSVADRSAALTRHLLAFARQHALSLTAVDARDVVRAAAELLSHEAGPQVRVEVELPAGPVGVRADAPLLEQVILNLGHNARDAMPDGGVLRLEAGLVRLDAPKSHPHGVIPAGEWVFVRVSDTGCGVGEHVLAHLLEPFFTTKPAGRGTGLGLPMAWGIVTQGGGHLAVDSAPGEGTRITLYLVPARLEVPAPAPAAPSTERARPLAGLRLLVVDDEAQVRRTLVRLMRARGAEVVEAADGNEALGVLQQAGPVPDAVLSDVTMPGLDGIGLGRALASRWPGLPLVLLSGHGDSVATAEGLPELRAFIAKPYEGDDVVQAVLSLVERARRTGPS